MGSPTEVYEGDKRRNFTATTTINGVNNVLGILVATSSGGTIKVADTQGTIMNTTTVLAGTFYPMPCKINGPMVITVTGTLDATAFYK